MHWNAYYTPHALLSRPSAHFGYPVIPCEPAIQLPKGAAPKPAASKSLNPFTRYKQRYFAAGNESGAPIIHVIFGGFGPLP